MKTILLASLIINGSLGILALIAALITEPAVNYLRKINLMDKEDL